jgi:hypothetical protein
MQQKEGLWRRIGSTIRTWKALPRYFPLYFQLPYPPEDQYAGSLAVEGTSQAVLGSSCQWKVPASLSLFVKSEKIIVLLCVGKGHEYRRFFRDFFYCSLSLPASGNRAQITEGPEYSPFSYMERTATCFPCVYILVPRLL